MNGKQRRIGVFAVAWLIVFCLFAGGCSVSGELPDVDGKGSMFGKKAPDFEIKGAYGEVYSLDRLKGHVILLQFGTSW